MFHRLRDSEAMIFTDLPKESLSVKVDIVDFWRRTVDVMGWVFLAGFCCGTLIGLLIRPFI